MVAQPLFGPDDRVELASVNISFPITDLYEGVVLPEDTGNF